MMRTSRGMGCWALAILTIVAILKAAGTGRAQTPADPAARLAETPPMGWNSYDGYGTTINETDFRANAKWLADHLQRYGWEYVVIDAEWFVKNPVAEGNSKTSQYAMDSYGRYIPAPNRFASAEGGQGFKPLAAYTHSLGLKFGIHILRGIPKEAVTKNLPIAGSAYHVADAADAADTCPWNYDNFGADASKPAGQAYYDSILQLYAEWGVDLIKVDCISSHPYKGDEIRMLSEAIRKTNRAILLSLSPGPAPLEKSDELSKYAQMWRISDDIWDLWHSDKNYPQGVVEQFPNAAKWSSLSGPGHWPDADMLPIGRLGPAPGWGAPRNTRLTRDEQRTLLTLWCIFRSPLMIGGHLTASDGWTTALLSNPEVLAMDQHSVGNRQVLATAQNIVWVAQPQTGQGHFVAVFNLTQEDQTASFSWSEIGLKGTGYRVRDLWEQKDLGSVDSLKVPLKPHGAALYLATPATALH